MKIFLIAGWSGAGKDTAADFLVKEHNFTKFAFADAAKQATSEEYGFPISWTKTQEGKKETITLDTNTTLSVRELIIKYANTQRENNPYIWAEDVAKKIKNSNSKNIVISDWRFLDELIGLQRSLPEATLIPLQIVSRGQYISPIADATEYGLLGFPFSLIIENPGDWGFFVNILRILSHLIE